MPDYVMPMRAIALGVLTAHMGDRIYFTTAIDLARRGGGRDVRWPALVPVRRLGVEICCPLSRVRQTVRMRAESDPKTF